MFTTLEQILRCSTLHVEFLKTLFQAPFCKYINDIGSVSSKLSFTLVADDTNIFKKDTVVNRNN